MNYLPRKRPGRGATLSIGASASARPLLCSWRPALPDRSGRKSGRSRSLQLGVDSRISATFMQHSSPEMPVRSGMRKAIMQCLSAWADSAFVGERHPEILHDVRTEQRAMLHDIPPDAMSVEVRPRMDCDARWWPQRQQWRWPTWGRGWTLSVRRGRHPNE